MDKLNPSSVHERMLEKNEKICFVDVRSEDEFRSGHVPGATCIPLDRLETSLASFPKDQLVILSCQSGKRSAQAFEMLKAKGFTNIVEMDGGFSAWMANGLPVRRIRNAIPLFRQVLLTAGILIFSGSLLGIFVNSAFFAIPIFMGAGLSFAGATGWCGLALLLERMPWNRASPS